MKSDLQNHVGELTGATFIASSIVCGVLFLVMSRSPFIGVVLYIVFIFVFHKIGSYDIGKYYDRSIGPDINRRIRDYLTYEREQWEQEHRTPAEQNFFRQHV